MSTALVLASATTVVVLAVGVRAVRRENASLVAQRDAYTTWQVTGQGVQGWSLPWAWAETPRPTTPGTENATRDDVSADTGPQGDAQRGGDGPGERPAPTRTPHGTTDRPGRTDQAPDALGRGEAA